MSVSSSFDAAYDATYSMWQSHPTEIALGAFTVAVGLALAFGIREIVLARQMKYVEQYIPHKREKMLRREREKFVSKLSADVYIQGMEKLTWEGAITELERNKEYRKISNYLKNFNIMPKAILLKAAIEKRLEKKKLHPPKEKKYIAQTKAPNVVAFGDQSIRRRQKTA